MEAAIQEVRDKKSMGGDDNVPGDVIQLLVEDGLKLMTQLINSIYKICEWPQDFTEAPVIVLKKAKARKCSNHCTIRGIAHNSKESSEVTWKKD